jgi:subtilisin family serine protease
LLKEYNFTIKKDDFLTNQFLIKIDNISTSELFKLAEILQENKSIDFAEPNFIRFIKPQTADPFYGSQWAINNQGYLGGTVDADMDVDEAWNYSTGNGIKVAIIDEGVDLNHPDLKANLLPGYDATGGNSSGAPSNNDAHGTSCAGIVAAVANNNIGTVGVAYNSKIIPIRIAFKKTNGLWQINDDWVSNGISFAVQNGADVLSNSWGGGSPSATITNAINNAVTNGRNGKGCIVLFSSGNDNGAVSFPATLDNVVAVGASSMCDQRKTPTSCDGEYWWGSNYGAGIDVIAPGVKIYTADISGPAGYAFGDYKSDFNGTSSACPNVAGVVALMLFLKPNLTGVEARRYLETSTDKVVGYSYASNVTGQTNGTWNNEVGYGRINAMSAVFKVLNQNITGNSTICSSVNNTYTIKNYMNGFVTTWSCSSNLILSNPTNETVNVIANGSGSGIITATLQNGQTITKNVWIGIPNPYETAERTSHCSFSYRATEYPNTSQSITSYNWQLVESTPNVDFSSHGDLATFTACPPFSITMKLTTTNACGTSEKFVSQRLNNDEEEINKISQPKSVFKIYPNPSSEITDIDLRNQYIKPDTKSRIKAELYNINGQIKYKVEIINNIASINVTRLPKGIYVLKINIDGAIESHQVAVE